MRNRSTVIAAAIIAMLAGIYWFQSAERNTTPAGKGAMAAFLVKPDRKPVPDLGFQDGAGKPVKLSDWKGRVALINLWATWCAPCRKEMPALARLQARLGSKDFEVLAISIDRKGVAASAAFLKETDAEILKLYIEPSTRILNDLQAMGLPVTVLVDRQGNEIGRLLGPAEWDSPEAVKLIEDAMAEK